MNCLECADAGYRGKLDVRVIHSFEVVKEAVDLCFGRMIRGLAIAFVWGQVGLWCACAGSGESAHLVASVLPGPLELVSPAVVVLEEEFDVGAVREFRFVIKDVIVNDLDGDGRGWELRAYPSAMEGENGGVFF